MTTAVSHTIQDAPDVDPDCPTCKTFEAVVFTGRTRETVAALGELPGLKYGWQCLTCRTEWTTLAVTDITPCPDGLAWCDDHEVDESGTVHRTAYLQVFIDGDGDLNPACHEEFLTVNGSRLDRPGGVREPVVYVGDGEGFLHFNLADGIALSPRNARKFAHLLVQVADQLEGGEPR